VDAIEVESLVGDWGFEVGAEKVYFRLSPPPEKWMQKRLHLWLKIGSSGSSLGALWELFGSLSQLRISTPAALLQNDTLFRSVYSPNDAPEVLFRRIEDCQEVQILGEDLYTAQQLLNNPVRLLLQCGLYTRDFEDWDCKPSNNRIWTNLKTFV